MCYHGFTLGDEHEFAPHVFMRAETFKRRMLVLKARGVPIIGLDDAIRRLQERAISNAETVITFDDGWATTLTVGAPILEQFGFPACIYATTEHLTAGTEAFNVALAYMLHRSARRTLTLAGLHPQLDGSYDIGTAPETVAINLIRAAEQALPLTERQRLLRPIAEALGFDLDTLLKDGRFSLLSRSEIRELWRRGFDFQLHTHSHRVLPECDFEAAVLEIEQNRAALRQLTNTTANHFCYPSGQYTADRHPAWLRRLGITSATTCDPGFNDAGTPILLLHRYVDSDSSSDVEFEAEVCGVRQVARRVRARAGRWTTAWRRSRAPA